MCGVSSCEPPIPRTPRGGAWPARQDLRCTPQHHNATLRHPSAPGQQRYSATARQGCGQDVPITRLHDVHIFLAQEPECQPMYALFHQFGAMAHCKLSVWPWSAASSRHPRSIWGVRQISDARCVING